MKKALAGWSVLAFLLISLSRAVAVEAPPLIYRMNQLEEAKKRAVAEDKPIAWIGTLTKYLAPYHNLKGQGSHAATSYAIRALQKETILIYSDGDTQNHQEPTIVDQALHSPEAHYRLPAVIILTPSLDKVIAKTFRKENADERAREFLDLLKKIRDKKSWHENKAAK
ncbi:MAG: hypothetical protein ABI042_10455 [Verrucomicrobiota bacterium]